MAPRLLLCALMLLSYAIFATALGPRNFSIDDTKGDEQTRVIPQYAPDITEWDSCPVKPEPTKAWSSTWTAITLNSENTPDVSITFTFKGTAVYVCFILPNNIPNHPMNTECYFSVDGQAKVRFAHSTSQSGDSILYNQLVFSQGNLSNQEHTVRINRSSPQTYINFDYALYTGPDESPADTGSSFTIETSSHTISSPSPPQTLSAPPYPSSEDSSSPYMSTTSSDVPAVATAGTSSSHGSKMAGGIVGGVAGTIMLCILIYYTARRLLTRSRRGTSKAKDPTAPTPFRVGEDDAEMKASHSPAMIGAKRKGHRQRQRRDRLQQQIEQFDRELRELNERASMYTTRRQRTRSAQGQDEAEGLDVQGQIRTIQEQISVLQAQQGILLAAQDLSNDPPPIYEAHGPINLDS